MKKKLLIVCNILALLLLSGCSSGISAEERNRAENAEKEAVSVLHDHFKSKYGIDVEIESTFTEFSGCGHDTDRSFTGHIQATVSYNDWTFSANVEDKIVYDNYQAKELEQACLTYALEKLNLPQPVFYKISPHYSGHIYNDFGALLLNDYFDGTNIEEFFNMISPGFKLVYESDAVYDSAFPEKLAALFENTAYDEQSMEFIILEKGSADKISPIRWHGGNTAENYAPYVEYSAIYRKNGDIKPEINEYMMEPLSNDLPILKEFLILNEKHEPNDFVVRQEEPLNGWDIEQNFEQIMPSYHFQWNENDRSLRHIFIPSSVWGELCETYDEIHLIEYRENPDGEVSYMKSAMNPNITGYSDVALFGDFFSFRIGRSSTDYITFVGIRK